MSKIKKYYIDDNLFEDLPEKRYQIWQEGFKIGNIIQEAEYHGEAEGKDFEQACLKYFKNDPNFNYRNLTFFGCKLFNNENDARIKEKELKIKP